MRRNLAHLQVCAGGDVAERPAEFVAEIGETRELPVLHDPVRDAQPRHVAVLRRTDIKDAVIAPAEIVGGRWPRIDGRLISEPRISVERMLLALPLLLIDKLLTGSRGAILCLDMRGIRPCRLGIGLASRTAAKPLADAADLQARRKAFEIALLLVREVDGNRFDFHAATKLLRGNGMGRTRPLRISRPLLAGLSGSTVRSASLLRISIWMAGRHQRVPAVRDIQVSCQRQIVIYS